MSEVYEGYYLIAKLINNPKLSKCKLEDLGQRVLGIPNGYYTNRFGATQENQVLLFVKCLFPA